MCIIRTIGFEAINTSLYDRSAAIYEAITCAARTNKKSNLILLAESLFESEVNVINTLSEETDLNFLSVPTDNQTGLINYRWLENQDGETLKNISCVCLPSGQFFGS